MGTGIVANAGALLPVRVTGLHAAARAVWTLAALLLIALTATWAVHWIRHRDRALAHAADPVMSHFWGAPAMALMTVGAGARVVHRVLDPVPDVDILLRLTAEDSSYSDPVQEASR
jgi:tellurite resistance protein TehA-like permease